MSAINYRNVLDYVAEKYKKKNYTWGADVELLAAALLIQTDIGVFSSDIGKKLMVFSGRGAKFLSNWNPP